MEYDIPYPTYIPYIGPNNAPLGVKCQGRVVTCFNVGWWYLRLNQVEIAQRFNYLVVHDNTYNCNQFFHLGCFTTINEHGKSLLTAQALVPRYFWQPCSEKKNFVIFLTDLRPMTVRPLQAGVRRPSTAMHI